MREMKDSGIEWVGEIPQTWSVQKLKYTLVQRVQKNTPIKSEDILSLTAKQGVVPYSEKEGVGGNKPKENLSSYNLAYPKDIVMNSMNVISGSVGISNYFGCVSPVYYMFYSCIHDTRFFNYVFQTTVFQRSLLGLGNGILMKESENGKFNTVRMRIPMDRLGQIFLPICNACEQQKIADFLDEKCAEIDALTSDIQTQIETLEEYKKSLIYRCISRGFSKDSELKETDSKIWSKIPSSWKLVDIKYLFNIVKRIAGKEGFDVLSVTQSGLKIKDITSGEGQLANDYSGYQFVYPGDFVMNHMDLLTGWVDLSKMFGVTSPDYRVFKLKDNQSHIDSYYKYVMQCCYLNRIFYQLGQGVANLGRWRLQTSSFNNFKIPVPPVHEQKMIADFLNCKCTEINMTISEKQQQLETLAEYKKSLIYEYVTGKKEVA